MTDTSASAASSSTILFEPVTFGDIELANRVVMAPMTRLRADHRGVPGELVARYYSQRAAVGLIVTEGTYPSFESQTGVQQPGIADAQHAAGWSSVADEVHKAGGKIVLQLMHGGRTAHPVLNGRRRVIAPSPVPLTGTLHTDDGKHPFPVPEEMTPEDIQDVVAEHVAAARRAVDAGLDGVEVHGANGYLGQQFLSPASNQRSDRYGGDPENRARFLIELVSAIAAEIGPGRVGLRISPENDYQETFETDRSDVLATYGALLDALRPLGIAYLSIVHVEPAGDVVRELAGRFGGPVAVNGGGSTPTSLEDAVRIVAAPFIDAAVVGRAVLANPDLVARWRRKHPVNEPRAEHFYTHDGTGYIDYAESVAG